MKNIEAAILTGSFPGLESRARQSLGISNDAIYRMVTAALDAREAGGSLIDVGCGAGNLWPFVGHRFENYIGIDAVNYNSFPSDGSFVEANLDVCKIPLPDESAEVVTAVEVIEHLENPRALVREMVRLAKPGGWILVTTPNQLSFLSLLTLVVKKRFSAFQDVQYPAHLTALLEIDLRRIASESGLIDVVVAYSCNGRLVLTPWHYPRFLTRRLRRSLSDNVLLIGRKLSPRR
jgi:2-polyprenyl-3-methyl-5-hydroxy-6-metoxy-1,4-benzoquinol methylase